MSRHGSKPPAIVWIQPRPMSMAGACALLGALGIFLLACVGLTVYFARPFSAAIYGPVFISLPALVSFGVCLHRLVFRRSVAHDAERLVFGRVGLPLRKAVRLSDAPSVSVEAFEGKAPEDANRTWYRVVVRARGRTHTFVFSQASDANGMAAAIQNVIDQWNARHDLQRGGEAGPNAGQP